MFLLSQFLLIYKKKYYFSSACNLSFKIFFRISYNKCSQVLLAHDKKLFLNYIFILLVVQYKIEASVSKNYELDYNKPIFSLTITKKSG